MGVHDGHQREGGGDRGARDARAFVENVEELVRRMRPGEVAPAISVDGDDVSGTVYCVVDVGGALTRVGIDDGWWDALGPSGVARAVLDAMRFAKAKAAMARLVLDRHGCRVSREPVDLAGLFTATTSEPLPPYAADGFVDVLARKADRALTILDAAQRFGRTCDPSRRRVVSGPRGMFRVHLAGLDVVGAEVDEDGLRRSDADPLAVDALAALSAATSPVYRTQQVAGRSR